MNYLLEGRIGCKLAPYVAASPLRTPFFFPSRGFEWKKGERDESEVSWGGPSLALVTRTDEGVFWGGPYRGPDALSLFERIRKLVM